VIKGSIPVKITQNFIKDGAKGNMENPIFIHKSEKVASEKTESLNTALNNQVNNDITIIKDKLKVADNKKQKLRVLKDGLKRLEKESQAIAKRVESGISDVLRAKEVGNRLNCLLDTYEMTLRKNEASKLKLVDVIDIKKQLKVKLLKEISGIRTSDNDFEALRKVNQNDIKRVIKDIKRKLEGI